MAAEVPVALPHVHLFNADDRQNTQWFLTRLAEPE
jgi:hypothetical protein